MRIETDFIGGVELRDNQLFGIQTFRAFNNFFISNDKLDAKLILAYAVVKMACCKTNMDLGYIDKKIGNSIIDACEEILKGNYHDQIIVHPLQGGAGTSINQNFNEVIANIALFKLNKNIGDYDYINPLNHINLHQSTNDTFPTALRVAILLYLKELEIEIASLQKSFQNKEQEFKDIVKLGRTQLQDAVPMTLGMTFGSFGEAIARDRWRIFKNRERIKTINLGGTAIGTGLNAPREYIFKVGEVLRNLTGLSISRSENLIDATQNLDSLVEISGMLKSYAVNLIKINNDLRLLSCGPDGGIAEIILPSLQAGSTIMPGKVNPVIPEMMIQVAIKVIANDSVITTTASMGQLELNHLLPLLADSILESLKLLIESTKKFNDLCVNGIKANENKCLTNLINSKTLATVLVNKFGYKEVEEILHNVGNNNLKKYLIDNNILTENEVKDLLSPTNMYKLGF